MADIKIKKKNNGTIKKLDKATNYSKKLKDNIVNIKEKSDYKANEESTPTEYGENKITQTTEFLTRKGIKSFTIRAGILLPYRE